MFCYYHPQQLNRRGTLKRGARPPCELATRARGSQDKHRPTCVTWSMVDRWKGTPSAFGDQRMLAAKVVQVNVNESTPATERA